SANRTFLPAVGKNGCCWGTWQIAILPYVEQESLFKLYINFDGLDANPKDTVNYPRYGEGQNVRVSGSRLKAFTCPSDTPQSWGSLSKHNYALNAGNTTFYQVPLPLGCTVGKPGCTPFLGAPFGYYYPSNLNNDSPNPWSNPPTNPENGQMGRQVAVSSIRHGTSNTLLASEVIQGRGDDLRGVTWWSVAAGVATYCR